MKKLLQVAFLILMTQSALSAQNTGPNPTEKFNADNEYNPITIRNPVKLGDRTATLQFNGWLTPFGYRTGAELTTIVSALPVADDLPLDIVLRTGGNNIRNRLRVGNNGFVSINSDDLPAQFSVTQFSDQNPPNHNILLVRGGTSHNIKSFRLFTDASDVLNAILEGNMEINNGNLIVRDGKLGVGDADPQEMLTVQENALIKGNGVVLGKLFLAEKYTPGQGVENYKIFADGGVLCTEVRILYKNNWPDYVFKSDYPLMPLKDLSDYIRANGHLPNIPTANDVHSNGINVAETQKLLLEKIEELTLYMLKQQGEIQLLNQKIDAIKSGKAGN